MLIADLVQYFSYLSNLDMLKGGDMLHYWMSFLYLRLGSTDMDIAI